MSGAVRREAPIRAPFRATGRLHAGACRIVLHANLPDSLMQRFSGQPHIASYYAATANDAVRHPSLVDALTVDVCVIGAGLTGISAALELAERGFSVAVLEASKIGWAASGRNGGQLIGGFACTMDEFRKHLDNNGVRRVWKMGQEAVSIVKARIARHNIECNFVPGYITVANKPRHLDALRRARDDAATHYAHEGLRFVERSEMPRYVQSSRYVGGLYDPDSGHLHPLNYTLGLARAAAAAGARLFEDSCVLAIETGAGKHLALTATGSVLASFVVLACNAYLGGLAPALARKIMPVGTYLIATEPLGAERIQALMPARAAVCDSRFVLDYFRPLPDGRLLWGGKVSYSAIAPRNLAHALRRDMLKTFPHLADVKIDYTWGGFVDITMNRAPHFGRLAPTIYFAQGFSGHGVNTTALAGKLIAEAIHAQATRLDRFGRLNHSDRSDRSDRFDLFAQIPHRDFPGGPYLRMPALVLAMAWFRLKDLL
jgi:gamma-glutamylputrescine oxidase